MSVAEAGVASGRVKVFHFYPWGFNLALRIRLPLRDRLAWLALYVGWYRLAKLIAKLPGKRYWECAEVAAGEPAFVTVRPRFTRVRRGRAPHIEEADVILERELRLCERCACSFL